MIFLIAKNGRIISPQLIARNQEGDGNYPAEVTEKCEKNSNTLKQLSTETLNQGFP